jgi:multiple sugar transport system permease protein
LALSLKTPDQILQTLFFPARPTLANWLVTFSQVPLGLYVRNSIMAATFASLITLALTLPSTYAICRLNVASGLLSSLTLSTYVAPPPFSALVGQWFVERERPLNHET